MKKKIILLFFILFILTLPIMLRFFDGNFTLPGTVVYENLMNESYSGTAKIIPFIVSKIPFDLLFFPPLILLLFSFILIVLILKQLKISSDFSLLFLLIFSLCPLTQSLGFFVDEMSFVFPFFLLGLFFLLKKRLILGAIPLIFTSLIGPEHALINIFVILAVKKYYFNEKKLNILAGLIVVLLGIIHFSFLFNLANIYSKQVFEAFFSEFGSYWGFAVFELFLACFGFVGLLRKYKQQYFSLFLLAVFILFFSVLCSDARIYTLLIIVFLSSSLISYLYKRQWQIKSLKNIVLLTIFCGLLFTCISHSIVLSDAPPSSKLVQGFVVLSKKPYGNVLTAQDYNFFVEFYAEKNPLLKKGVSSLFYSDYLNMLHSTDLSETLDLMKKYSVRYVVITPEMKDGIIWKKNEEGLLFLIGHSKNFKEIMKNGDVEILEVRYGKKV